MWNAGSVNAVGESPCDAGNGSDGAPWCDDEELTVPYAGTGAVVPAPAEFRPLTVVSYVTSA